MEHPETVTFVDLLKTAVGRRNVLTSQRRLKSYQTGYRMGAGKALAAVIPATLVEFWRVLKICIEHDKIVIVQAANTGLNGGSTPDGDDYDRDIVIISTLKIDKIVLLNEGHQVLGFAGSTLYKLEDALAEIDRSPHSIIGSSCIGASIVGGVCNNSGGSLAVSYTHLTLPTIYSV